MGKHKINDEGHWRWFDSDEDYYAFKQARSYFDSADNYDEARAFCSSDTDLVRKLQRKNDYDYQYWLAHHDGVYVLYDERIARDTEEAYQEYLKRLNDNMYIDWLYLYHRSRRPESDDDNRYNQYLSEKADFYTEEEYATFLKSKIAERDAADELKRDKRRKTIEKIIETIFGIIAAVFIVLGIRHHWSIIVILIILAIIFVTSKIVIKKLLY